MKTKLGKPSQAKLVKVNSLDELKHPDERDYKMFLGGGIVFSRKTIRYHNGSFYVINHIDGSCQLLTEAEMMDRNVTNIGASIEHGTFYGERREFGRG